MIVALWTPARWALNIKTMDTGAASLELPQQRARCQAAPPGAVNREVAGLGLGGGLALFSQPL